jgi:hypothetical protein
MQMTAENDLSTHFISLGLPEAARAWLLDLWCVIQVLDDAADGDRSEDAGRAAMAVFWDLPLNPFYRDHVAALQPVLMLQVLKWRAANALEAIGAADERTYMARAGFYDVVMMVCQLCGVKDFEAECLMLYGETYAQYQEGQKCQAL